MLTCGEILLRAATKCGIDPVNNTAYINNTMFRFLQDVYREIWNSSVWPELVADDFTLVLPGNSLVFTLSKQYDAIQRCYNLDTGQPLKIRDRASFADVAYQPGVQFTRDMQFDAITRLIPSSVSTQLSGAAQLVKVKSSAAGDTTQSIFVRGLDSNSERISETINLNGVTAVASANTYTFIEAWSKTAIPTAGFISLTDNAGNTLGTLGVWETVPKYERYQLDGISSAAINLQITAKRAFVPFEHYYDYPFTELDLPLIDELSAMVWDEHKRLDLSANARQQSRETLNKITDREENQDDVILMVPQQRG